MKDDLCDDAAEFCLHTAENKFGDLCALQVLLRTNHSVEIS